MNLDSLDPDGVEAALLDCGALSVTFTDAGEAPVLEPAPGGMPLWPTVKVTALFDETADLAALAGRLCATLDVSVLPKHQVENLAERAWEREWLKDFGPMRFGRRLWVVPGQCHDLPDDAIVVRLDPGLAFGSGAHQTTALCLRWLESESLSGKTVLDFGCGSGILGIAALRLGAGRVAAIDTDLQAVTATGQNAQRNSVENRLHACTVDSLPAAQFDLVVANILASTLIDNADVICDAAGVGARIALSGVLAHQAAAVQGAFRDRVTFEAPVMQDDWALLSGTRT